MAKKNEPKSEESVNQTAVEEVVEVEKAPEFTVKVAASSGGAPTAKKMPDVRGGICEFCGVVDPTVPADLQYTLCKHYKALGDSMRCSFCPIGTDLDDVRKHRVFKIKEYPVGSGNLVVVCDDINCVHKFEKEYNILG